MCAFLCMCIQMFVHRCKYLGASICACAGVCAYLYTHIYRYMCVYTCPPLRAPEGTLVSCRREAGQEIFLSRVTAAPARKRQSPLSAQRHPRPLQAARPGPRHEKSPSRGSGCAAGTGALHLPLPRVQGPAPRASAPRAPAAARGRAWSPRGKLRGAGRPVSGDAAAFPSFLRRSLPARSCASRRGEDGTGRGGRQQPAPGARQGGTRFPHCFRRLRPAATTYNPAGRAARLLLQPPPVF